MIKISCIIVLFNQHVFQRDINGCKSDNDYLLVHKNVNQISEYFIGNYHHCKLNSLEPRNLDKPTNVAGVDVMFNGPASQLVPLVHRSAVYRQPVLGILVLVFLQIRHHFLHKQQPTHFKALIPRRPTFRPRFIQTTHRLSPSSVWSPFIN